MKTTQKLESKGGNEEVTDDKIRKGFTTAEKEEIEDGVTDEGGNASADVNKKGGLKDNKPLQRQSESRTGDLCKTKQSPKSHINKSSSKDEEDDANLPHSLDKPGADADDQNISPANNGGSQLNGAESGSRRGTDDNVDAGRKK